MNKAEELILGLRLFTACLIIKVCFFAYSPKILQLQCSVFGTDASRVTGKSQNRLLPLSFCCLTVSSHATHYVVRNSLLKRLHTHNIIIANKHKRVLPGAHNDVTRHYALLVLHVFQTLAY